MSPNASSAAYVRLEATRLMKKETLHLIELTRRYFNLPTITTIVIVLITAVAVACVSFSSNRRQGIENLQKDAESQLKNFSLRVSTPVDKYAYLPKLVSNYRIVVDALRNPRDRVRLHKANVLLERLNREAGSNFIYLLDLHGITIAASNWNDPKSFVGNDYSFRPYFLDAIRDGSGTFYAVGVTTGAPGYFISNLVRDHNDRALGVVVAKIDMTKLDHGWDKSEYEMMVTDENGVVFLSSQDEWRYRPIWALDSGVEAELRLTRQYEGVLKKALPVTLEETLRSGEQIVNLVQPVNNGHGGERVSYLLKSGKLPGSDWTIHILNPLRLR